MSPTRSILRIVFLGTALVAFGSGCATRGKVTEVPIETQVSTLSIAPADIQKCAQKITASISETPEFSDPDLRPHLIVELPKMDTSDRYLVMQAGMLRENLITHLMKAQVRQARIISREDLPRLDKERELIGSEVVVTNPGDDGRRHYRSADFFLFSTISDAKIDTTDRKQVSYIQWSFRLVERTSSLRVWSDDYKVMKQVKSPKIYH